jgi:hypothetical protein
LPRQWKRLHAPEDRIFETKIELAKTLFERNVADDLPCGWVDGDSFYGSDTSFQRLVNSRSKRYIFSLKEDEWVCLDNPLDSPALGQTLKNLAQHVDFEPVTVRDVERGALIYEHAFVPVWTVDKHLHAEQRKAHRELHIIRREPDKFLSDALSNVMLDDGAVSMVFYGKLVGSLVQPQFMAKPLSLLIFSSRIACAIFVQNSKSGFKKTTHNVSRNQLAGSHRSHHFEPNHRSDLVHQTFQKGLV